MTYVYSNWLLDSHGKSSSSFQIGFRKCLRSRFSWWEMEKTITLLNAIGFNGMTIQTCEDLNDHI